MSAYQRAPLFISVNSQCHIEFSLHIGVALDLLFARQIAVRKIGFWCMLRVVLVRNRHRPADVFEHSAEVVTAVL